MSLRATWNGVVLAETSRTVRLSVTVDRDTTRRVDRFTTWLGAVE